jgi:prepilin-type N-terminal cleavage/methylation domain-containing protein
LALSPMPPMCCKACRGYPKAIPAVHNGVTCFLPPPRIKSIYCRGWLNRLTGFRVNGFGFTGFTLAELLVALVIFGLAATFTIPKVLTAVDGAQDKARLKTIVSAISEVVYILSRDTYHRTKANLVRDDLHAKLNAGVFCNSNASSNTQCAPINPGYVHGSSYDWPDGFTMGGAKILWYSGGMPVEDAVTRAPKTVWASGIHFLIDVNGDAEPNLIGRDRLYMMACVDYLDCGGSWWEIKSGKAVPLWNTTDNVALYNSLFQ